LGFKPGTLKVRVAINFVISRILDKKQSLGKVDPQDLRDDKCNGPFRNYSHITKEKSNSN
jgi:hypothetical protein